MIKKLFYNKKHFSKFLNNLFLYYLKNNFTIHGLPCDHQPSLIIELRKTQLLMYFGFNISIFVCYCFT